jgi:mono/diheme cytochrome c family protein
VGAGTGLGEQAIERVRTVLPRAGLPRAIPLRQLTTREGLSQGRAVLLRKCVHCHDLRTVLAKPRTPENWIETVRRMAERAVIDPITEAEQWHVAAYLVAISPDLQKAMQLRRQQQLTQISPEVIKKPPVRVKAGAAPRAPFDLVGAKVVFESTCNGCHSLANVEDSPPSSEAEARDLVARMVENGLNAERGRLEQIVFYLARTYGK